MDVGLSPVNSCTIINSRNGMQEKLIIVLFPQEKILSRSYNENSYVKMNLY